MSGAWIDSDGNEHPIPKADVAKPQLSIGELFLQAQGLSEAQRRSLLIVLSESLSPETLKALADILAKQPEFNKAYPRAFRAYAAHKNKPPVKREAIIALGIDYERFRAEVLASFPSSDEAKLAEQINLGRPLGLVDASEKLKDESDNPKLSKLTSHRAFKLNRQLSESIPTIQRRLEAWYSIDENERHLRLITAELELRAKKAQRKAKRIPSNSKAKKALRSMKRRRILRAI